MKNFFNRIYMIEDTRTQSWIRLWPNPGVQFNFGPWRLYWSKHRGLNIRRVR